MRQLLKGRGSKHRTNTSFPKAIFDGNQCLGRSIRQSPSPWTIKGSGTFACLACVKQNRICFRWEASIRAFVALPLPPEIQEGVGPAQERLFQVTEIDFEFLRPLAPLWHPIKDVPAGQSAAMELSRMID